MNNTSKAVLALAVVVGMVLLVALWPGDEPRMPTNANQPTAQTDTTDVPATGTAPAKPGPQPTEPTASPGVAEPARKPNLVAAKSRVSGHPGGPVAVPLYGSTAVKEAVSDGGAPIRFTERTYDPPFELTYFDTMPDPASLETPEDVLGSQTTAMSKVQWDWWIRLWDRPSRAELSRVMRLQGVDKARFIEIWEVVAKGHRFVATRRIDLDGYVIIYTRRVGASDDELEAKTPVALKRDANGRWWLTHDLRDHPVFTYDLEGAREGVEVRTVD